jgi:hypothetical protein
MTKSDEGRLGIDGVIEWRDDEDELHRVGGPARVLPGGREEWFHHGRLHRSDGPAVIYPDGRRIWFIEGEKVREERNARQPSLVKAR